MPHASGALDQAARKFLDSPDGKKLIDDETVPLWLGLILAAGSVAVGCLMVPTIVKTAAGLGLIWRGLTFHAMTSSSGPKIQSGRDKVRGLIGHVIIVGPAMRPNRQAALMLGSFEEVAPDKLARLAESFGELYGASKAEKQLRPMQKLLKDDQFQENRRRPVPAAFSEGEQLYLFDIVLDTTQLSDDDQPLAACIANPGKSGAILQVPWEAVASVVGSSSGGANSLEEESDSSISLAMFATKKGTKLSIKALHDEIQSSWPDFPKMTDLTEDADSLSFQIGQAFIAMARMPAAIPWSDLEGPCQTSWLWKEATQVMKPHDEHFIITIGGESAPLERAKRLTQVIASLIATTEPIVGIYWSQAPLVMSPPMFRDFATTILPDGFPVYAWVDFRVGKNEKGKTSGFTSGMKGLGLMEFETESSQEPPGELLERLFGLVNYVLEHGPVIKNGDTVGEDENERIKVIHAKSFIGRPQKVMRLEYSSAR